MSKVQSDTIIDTYPLSPMQQGMLFHCISEPNSGVDVEQLVCTFQEDLNVKAFRAAWDQIISRHAVLRTSFRWEALKEPVQDVHSKVTLPLVERDWSILPP